MCEIKARGDLSAENSWSWSQRKMIAETAWKIIETEGIEKHLSEELHLKLECLPEQLIKSLF